MVVKYPGETPLTLELRKVSAGSTTPSGATVAFSPTPRITPRTDMAADRTPGSSATFWRSVLDADADYSLALVCYGNALHERGDLAGAEEAWNAAVRANPYDGTAWNQLGNLAFRRGDVLGAERDFASAVAFRPDLFDHVFNHALALDALGRREAARAELARARAILPPHRAALAAQIDARLAGAAP